MRSAALLGLLLTLGGCDGSPAAPGPAPATPALTATPATATAAPAMTPAAPTAAAAQPEDTSPAAPEARALVTGPCVASEAVALGQSQARRVSAEVAFGHDGGLVAFTEDDTHVSVRRLDADGQVLPGASSVALTNARDLVGLYRLAHSYLLLSHAVCPGGRRMNKCLVLRALAADGSARGPEHVETTREWMIRPQLRAQGDSLFVVRAHEYIPCIFEKYRVGEDGAITRELLASLNSGVEEGEFPAPLGLATGGTRVAAVLREYDARRERSVLHLYDADGSMTRLRLRVPAATASLELSFVDEDLMVLFRAGSRARVGRVGLDGRVTSPARTLDAEETIPENRVVPTVESAHHSLVFSRRDRAGRAIGEPVSLGAGDRAAVAGAGAVFAVASVLASRRDPSTISLTAIRCGE